MEVYKGAGKFLDEGNQGETWSGWTGMVLYPRDSHWVGLWKRIWFGRADFQKSIRWRMGVGWNVGWMNGEFFFILKKVRMHYQGVLGGCPR